MKDKRGRSKYAYIARDFDFKIISVGTTIIDVAEKLGVNPSLVAIRLKNKVSRETKIEKPENAFNIERIDL